MTRKQKGILLAIWLVTLFGLEGLSRTFFKLGLLHYIPFTSQQGHSNPRGFWQDSNPHFGVWHPKKAKFRHQSPCFDVVYQSNQFGARDQERNKKNTDGITRAVILGDSFVEGYGVDESDRVSNQLEKKTGIEHLNFGTSGDFGSIQAWRQYDTLVRQFDHNIVYIFFLPQNDFADNNPNHFPKNRYRPYLKKTSPEHYKLYYSVSFPDRARLETSTPSLWDKISTYSYFFNFIRNFNINLKRKFKKSVIHSYTHYTQDDLDKLLYTYKKIITLAGEKKVIIVSIPRYPDFLWHQKNGYTFKLVDTLHQFANTYPNVYYHDLLPDFVNYTKKTGRHVNQLNLKCDGHWSALGHTVASESLLQAFKFLY